MMDPYPANLGRQRNQGGPKTNNSVTSVMYNV